MLHVLLTILKIIGILLLVILGIILVLILLVLFVPVRYRVHVRKDRDVFEADGRVTWLLHLLRVDLTYAKRSGSAVIRLLGRTIKVLHFPREDEIKPDTDAALRSPEAADGSAGDKDETGLALKEEDAGQIGPEDRSGTGEEIEGKADTAGTKDETGSDLQKKTDTKGQTGDGADSGPAADAQTKDPSKGQDDSGDFAQTDKGQAVNRIIEKVLGLVEKLIDLIMRLLFVPYDIYDKIDSITDRIGAKVDAIRKKAAPFLTMEGEHVIGKIFRYLKKLVRCDAPRKISRYLRYGTEYPDMTGTITGLIYVLLPQAGSEYSVEPDFYEPKLETDTLAYGHIRMNHLVWAAIRILLDKEFWILLRRIRGKEKTKKHRGRSGSGSSGKRTSGSVNDSGSDEFSWDEPEEGVSMDGAGSGHEMSRKKPHKKKNAKKKARKKTGNRKIPKKR